MTASPGAELLPKTPDGLERFSKSQELPDWLESDSSGGMDRLTLIEKVAEELPDMGDTAWHVDRMVATMILAPNRIADGKHRLRLE